MNRKRLIETETEDIKKTVKKETKTEKSKPEDVAVKMENLTPEQIENTIKQIRKGKKVNQQNQNPEMEQSQENTRDMPEEREEPDAETKEMKEEILSQIFQLKSIDIEDREKLCKIRPDKRARKSIGRVKKAAKEIMNEREETVFTSNEVIYAGAYVITEKLNGKPKNYKSSRKHKQPMWKTKTEKEINEIRGEVAILDKLLHCVKVKSRKLNKMEKKYAVKKQEDLPPLKGTLKHNIQLKA